MIADSVEIKVPDEYELLESRKWTEIRPTFSILLCKGKGAYVTWIYDEECGEVFSGRYWDDYYSANADFVNRYSAEDALAMPYG